MLIPTGSIRTNPFRSRTYYDMELLSELADSITENGLIVPLTAAIQEDDTVLLISGERRFRAAIMAGITEIPCVLLDPSEMELTLFSLLENQQHQTLNYFEEAIAIENIRAIYGLDLSELSEKLSKSEAYITQKLRLLSIPEKLRKKMLENGLTERYAALILKADRETDREEIVERIIAEQLTLQETQTMIDAEYRGKKRKNHAIRIFKDLTVFMNTIERAVDTMTDSGIAAQLMKTENEKDIEYIIRIPKG